MPEEKKSSTALVSTIAVLILAVASFGTYKYIKKDSRDTPSDTTVTPVTPEPTPTPTPTPVTPPAASTNAYKNGTYSAKGDYVSPGGNEQIDVKVTLKDDVITAATVTSLAINPTSKIMQAKFISGVQAAVVGKKITDVVLTHVSGSSLAPKGWNDAIAEIQAQAKA